MEEENKIKKEDSRSNLILPVIISILLCISIFLLLTTFRFAINYSHSFNSKYIEQQELEKGVNWAIERNIVIRQQTEKAQGVANRVAAIIAGGIDREAYLQTAKVTLKPDAKQAIADEMLSLGLVTTKEFYFSNPDNVHVIIATPLNFKGEVIPISAAGSAKLIPLNVKKLEL